jgi:2-oxoisovalerate ferredoxin oxidoreductase beta subunit
VSLGDSRQIMQASRAIKRAVENQVRGLGFSMIEVLAPCPTIWKMDPVKAQLWVRDVLEKTFPLGVFCARDKDAQPRPAPEAKPALDQIPQILGVAEENLPEGHPVPPEGAAAELDLRVRVAGFGGQGVLLLGEVLAEAGLDAGFEVSWLPSYGPEMRSGTSNCHVRISRHTIDSPMVASPSLLAAMNEPSLRKFVKDVKPGGWVIYNGEEFPADCEQKGVHVLARNYLQIANELGNPRACNMVMLGALLEIAGVLQTANIEAALRQLVKPRWMELNQHAIKLGGEIAREERRKG